ncbi:ArgP/LysG family DNA-binding transcriptional regulator [Alisedimentitalea sp. MJ-SS2]|uniref:ArgP/LysG family DNA-binding transcriptional regulator n=1 Tax=Aliisedimentitalea sp. MJ-SS2 TaxID=3049795 RepID=UPI002910E918|nr:ArgP/LysG family DNA-binding transcriptional regulator [Alisedimentitalea sp. MJ-SS2]MDU8926606.1 ArgP/LysG family DNA-binding transcriptional regulator [Alisedimentitalea sp. MJ-SS2]
MQFDSRQLAALSAILRLGSFEAAAQELGVTQSAISQRLKSLEEQMGCVLVLRESPCRGTEAGNRLAAHAEAVALMEGQVSRDLGKATPSDGPLRVRVAVNADSLATWFLSALEEVEGLIFDLVIDDQDHSADWLRRGEVMAAVTSHARPVQGCDVLPLGRLQYVATASPAFHERWFSDGVNAKTLARAPMLLFNEKDGLQSEWLAAHFSRGLTPPTQGIPSTRAFVEASQRGIGWGMNPLPLIWRQLRRGHIVALKEDAMLETPLYWQVSRMLAPVLEPLTASIEEHAGKVLIK